MYNVGLQDEFLEVEETLSALDSPNTENDLSSLALLVLREVVLRSTRLLFLQSQWCCDLLPSSEAMKAQVERRKRVIASAKRTAL